MHAYGCALIDGLCKQEGYSYYVIHQVCLPLTVFSCYSLSLYMLVNWSVLHKAFSAEYADSLAVQYNYK